MTSTTHISAASTTHTATSTPSAPALSASPPARRIHQALTANLERRALTWLAGHAPGWLTSDQLTLLGFAAQVAAGAAYALTRYDRRLLLLVCGCIVLNWLGDSLDGTLARVRHQERPRFGFYVDHMVDLFGAVGLMAGLACSGLVHWQIALALLIAFLVLAGESFLAASTLSRFELSQGRFGPTEIRILLILANLDLLRSPCITLAGQRLLLFDLGGAIAAAVMLALAIRVTLRHTTQLYRLEPLKSQPSLTGQPPLTPQQPLDRRQPPDRQETPR